MRLTVDCAMTRLPAAVLCSEVELLSLSVVHCILTVIKPLCCMN